MKRIAILCLGVLAASGARAAVTINDRCDVAWLQKARQGQVDIDNKRIASRASDGKAHLVENSDVCARPVWDYVLKDPNPRVQAIWAGYRGQVSFEDQASLLLWADALYKASDEKAVAAFEKADAIFAEAQKVGAIRRGDKQALTAAYGEAMSAVLDARSGDLKESADDAIDAAPVSAPGDAQAAAQAKPEDVQAAQAELVCGGEDSCQSAKATGDNVKPGPLVKEFNEAVLAWAGALSAMKTSHSVLDLFLDERRHPLGGRNRPIYDLEGPAAAALPASQADVSSDADAMRSVFGYMTDAGIKDWKDNSEGRSFLAHWDLAQRNALAMRVADVVTAQRAVLALKPAGAAPADPAARVNVAALQAGAAREMGLAGQFDASSPDGVRAGQSVTADQKAQLQSVRSLTANGDTVTGTPVGGGAPISVPVHPADDGTPGPGDTAAVASALLSGSALAADAQAAVAALPPPSASAGAGQDAVSKGAGCDTPLDVFRGDVARYKRHRDDALADDAASNAKKRRDKEKQFADWSDHYMKDCRERADNDSSLDQQGVQSLLAQCRSHIADEHNQLLAAEQANEVSVSSRAALGHQEEEENINRHYVSEVPKAIPVLRRGYLENDDADVQARVLEVLGDRAGWKDDRYMTPFIARYFDENWTGAKLATSSDDCAFHKLKPRLKDPSVDNVGKYCVEPALIAYLRAAKGTVHQLAAPGGAAPDWTIK